MGGVGAALTGYLADGIGLNMIVWILTFVPIVGALLVALIKETRAPIADAIS